MGKICNNTQDGMTRMNNFDNMINQNTMLTTIDSYYIFIMILCVPRYGSYLQWYIERIKLKLCRTLNLITAIYKIQFKRNKIYCFFLGMLSNEF